MIATYGRTAAPAEHFSRLKMAVSQPISGLLYATGQWAVFIGQTIYLLPLTIKKYRRQTLEQMNSLAWGRGSIIVDGGVISVLLILGVAVGASLAVEAYSVLNIIGFSALSGIALTRSNRIVRRFLKLLGSN